MIVYSAKQTTGIFFIKFSAFQVEGTAINIDFGRVTTIPPIYERSTASNISFEERGERKVSEKCSPLSKESPVSRGVKLRPADSDAVLDTTPLLSPTMEKQFLMNTWPAPLFNNSKIQTTTGMEEDNSAFSIWEENYQDLSGWCMDPFQGRCAFPIGEFETSKCSDTPIEDNSVSIKKAVVNARDFHVIEEGSLDKSSPTIMDLPFVEVNINNQEDTQPVIKPEIIETKGIALADVLLDPTKSSIAMRTDDWIQLVTVNGTNDSLTNIQLESANDQNNSIISNEYLSPIIFELPKSEKNNWDTITTFETTETDSFDLLSYLCDDNIQSPDGSVSRDSGPTVKSTSSVASPVDDSSTTRESHNSRRNDVVSRNYVEEANTSSSSIAAISAALESVSKMSRRSSKVHNKRVHTRTRKDSESEGGGKKRCIDSDSEDRMSDCSYRESREKNNEASRKSRMNKKAKETEMMSRANELERDNRILKMKVEELEKLVTSMRTTILRSALKKSF